ncbi:HPP family protein [Thermoproteota archaeon]
MTKKPFTINIDDPFSKVWDELRLHKIRHLPVIDKQRKVCGIITQRDLYRTISPRKTMDGNFIYNKAELDSYILKHVMRKKIITLTPQDTLGKAIGIMVRTRYGCIPVVQDGNYICGVVTQIDVLNAIAKYFI